MREQIEKQRLAREREVSRILLAWVGHSVVMWLLHESLVM